MAVFSLSDLDESYWPLGLVAASTVHRVYNRYLYQGVTIKSYLEKENKPCWEPRSFLTKSKSFFAKRKDPFQWK